MSPRAFGHTGFTGTSLWIDPERDLYAVLLTNRVHPTPANDAIKAVRRGFHDAVLHELGR
jgi:CubicO group peptidase (beta-lactamase class C family)